jgi:hypothetical protein
VIGTCCRRKFLTPTSRLVTSSTTTFLEACYFHTQIAYPSSCIFGMSNAADPEVGKVSQDYAASDNLPLTGANVVPQQKNKKMIIIGTVLGALALAGIGAGIGIAVNNNQAAAISTSKSVTSPSQVVPVVSKPVVPIVPVDTTPTAIPAPVVEKPSETPVEPPKPIEEPKPVEQIEPAEQSKPVEQPNPVEAPQQVAGNPMPLNNQIKGKYVVYGNLASDEAVRSNQAIPQIRAKEPANWPADVKINSPWYCVEGVNVPIVKLSDGNVACASIDGVGCMWFPNQQSCYLMIWQGTTNSPGMIPARCTNHNDPTTWCGKGWAATQQMPPPSAWTQAKSEAVHYDGEETRAHPLPASHFTNKCEQWTLFAKDWHHFGVFRMNANGTFDETTAHKR